MKAVLALILGAAVLAACSPRSTSSSATEVVPSATAAPAPTPTVAVAANEKGEHVYKGTCAMCHATGAGGSPTFKSRDDWGPRIAKGKPTLYGHAMQGFTGAKGTMPARGGNPSLSDDDIKAAVDYMTAAAQ